MRHIVHFTLWCISGAFTLTGMLHWAFEEQFVIVRVFSYVMPWTLAILVPVALVSVPLRYYGLFLCSLLPIVYIIACYAPQYLSKPVAIDSGEQIKVMSFNVWSENTNMEAVSRVVVSERPDMLFLQEISQKQLDDMVRHLQTFKNNRLTNVSYDADRMLASLSHFPFVVLNSPGSTRAKIQKIRLESKYGAIIVFNVHFDRGKRQKLNKDIDRFIKEHLTGNPFPVLLVGDFNTTSQTPVYRALKLMLKNSHDEAGWGFGFTYPAELKVLDMLPLPAMVRIDHIFYSSHFRAAAAKTIPRSGGSDHYPVFAKLLFTTRSHR